MAKTLHKVQEYRFGDRVIFRKTSVTTDSPEHFDDNEDEEYPFDAHGHAIRKAEEYGGQCVCGADLCKDCAQNRCEPVENSRPVGTKGPVADQFTVQPAVVRVVDLFGHQAI